MFIGNFDPSLIKTNDIEVAVQTYSEGDFETQHHHKVATEITVVVVGSIMVNDTIYNDGDILVVKPDESVWMKCLTNATTVVVKYPGPNNDKYED